jgi:hypothetical protein
MFLLELIVVSWGFGPSIFGFYARTSHARVLLPNVVSKYYFYLPIHAAIFGISSLFTPVSAELFMGLSISVSCAWFFLFNYFDADQPDHVPLGVRLWAYLWPGVLQKDQSGQVDLDRLEERIKGKSINPLDAARDAIETYKAKIDTHKLRAAKEDLDAQTELARAAREYNEARLRAEEAKRRSEKLGQG